MGMIWQSGIRNKVKQLKGIVYIMTNNNNTVLYTGVTSELKERVNQHKSKVHIGSFSARYNASKLVYFETLGSIGEAIKREKQIKGGSRREKIELINAMNPKWIDLSLTLKGE